MTGGTPALVLASSSPRRRELLAAHGFEFIVAPALVDESADPWLSARELVLLNAGRKSRAQLRGFAGAVVLGVDTLVSLDGKALGKPRDLADAAEMLARLAGRTHTVYTGVSLARDSARDPVSFVEETRVTFQRLSSEEIRVYHQLVNPLDKAGGYAAQEHAERIIATVEGSWTNVIGLPMERLTAVLAQEFAILPRR